MQRRTTYSTVPKVCIRRATGEELGSFGSGCRRGCRRIKIVSRQVVQSWLRTDSGDPLQVFLALCYVFTDRMIEYFVESFKRPLFGLWNQKENQEGGKKVHARKELEGAGAPWRKVPQHSQEEDGEDRGEEVVDLKSISFTRVWLSNSTHRHGPSHTSFPVLDTKYLCRVRESNWSRSWRIGSCKEVDKDGHDLGVLVKYSCKEKAAGHYWEGIQQEPPSPVTIDCQES